MLKSVLELLELLFRIICNYKMHKAYFVSSVLLQTCFLLSTFAQSDFVPVEWDPEVVIAEECPPNVDFSSAIGVVAEQGVQFKTLSVVHSSFQVLRVDKGELSSQPVWILHH